MTRPSSSILIGKPAKTSVASRRPPWIADGLDQARRRELAHSDDKRDHRRLLGAGKPFHGRLAHLPGFLRRRGYGSSYRLDQLPGDGDLEHDLLTRPERRTP